MQPGLQWEQAQPCTSSTLGFHCRRCGKQPKSGVRCTNSTSRCKIRAHTLMTALPKWTQQRIEMMHASKAALMMLQLPPASLPGEGAARVAGRCGRRHSALLGVPFVCGSCLAWFWLQGSDGSGRSLPPSPEAYWRWVAYVFNKAMFALILVTYIIAVCLIVSAKGHGGAQVVMTHSDIVAGKVPGVTAVERMTAIASQ